MNAAKRSILVAAAAAAGIVAFTASCAPKKTTLYIYNWDAYLKPELKAAFEEKFNCKVQEDIFDSNEMLEAKIKGGGSNYDILVPSCYFVERMYKQGMLMDIDPAKVPNLKNVDKDITEKLSDKEMKHSVPYMMSYTALGYLKSDVTDFEPTWKMFEREGLKKRFTLLNDLREVLGAALKTLGYSVNSTDPAQIREAAEVAMNWKKNAAKFDNEQYKNGLASGEFKLVMGYTGDMMQVQEEDNDDIEIVIPKEGTTLSVDMLVIPANSQNPDLAHAFINFVHDPANAAANTEFIYYLCPNTPSYELIDEEVRSNPVVFPDHEIMQRSEMIQDVGDAITMYNDYWEKIKSKDTLD